MKKFEVTLLITTEDKFNTNEFMLLDHDVSDGYELIRSTSNDNDDTNEYQMTSAFIKEIKEIKE